MGHAAAVTREELLARLRRELPRLRLEYAVRSFGLFGSFARREQGEGSDVDLLVDYDQTPGMFRFLDLEEELETILGCRVDLVTRDALKPGIGERILAELQIV